MTNAQGHAKTTATEAPQTTSGKYCPSCHSVYLPTETEANFCAKDGGLLLNDQPIFGGKYVLGELLGFGHMSQVYVATQAGMGRKIALKLLRAEHRLNPDMRKRFEREAQIASSLDHPNAVTIFDSGHTPDGQSYIAMELLNGETLDRVIQREAPMPFPRAMELLIPALRALAAAHTHQIIHRDVKPENVFVAWRRLAVGGEEIVKVLDFGIARVLGRKTRLTATHTALGTPHYMAPETLQGQEATPQSDVFAVGVILTEMLTGRLPWGETSRSEVSSVMSRLVSAPKPLSELLPNAIFPVELQAVLNQFLSLSLEDRPTNCAVALQILLQLFPGASGSPYSGPWEASLPTEPDGKTGKAPPTVVGAPITVISTSGTSNPLGSATSILGRDALEAGQARKWSVAKWIAFVSVAFLLALFVSRHVHVTHTRPGDPNTAALPPKETLATRNDADSAAAQKAATSSAAKNGETEKPTSSPSKRTRTRKHTQRTKTTEKQQPNFPLDTQGY